MSNLPKSGVLTACDTTSRIDSIDWGGSERGLKMSKNECSISQYFPDGYSFTTNTKEKAQLNIFTKTQDLINEQIYTYKFEHAMIVATKLSVDTSEVLTKTFPISDLGCQACSAVFNPHKITMELIEAIQEMSSSVTGTVKYTPFGFDTFWS